MENYIEVKRIFNWYSGSDNELMFDVKNKNSHLIYLALIGDSEASRLMVDLFGMKRSLFDQYVSSVHKQNDVGSFYPQYYVSLMPPESIFGNPEKQRVNGKIHDLFFLITECLKGNELYIKASNIKFHIERKEISDPDNFFVTVQNACNSYFTSNKRAFLKEINIYFN